MTAPRAGVAHGEPHGLRVVQGQEACPDNA